VNFGGFGQGKNKAKTKPKQSQNKANQSQNKANQSQFEAKTNPKQSQFSVGNWLCAMNLCIPVFYADFTHKIVCFICDFNHIIFIMVIEQDKQIVTRFAGRYNASSVILFGSSLKTAQDANDIDPAVKGIKANLFFKFHAELFKNLSKPVDLTGLSVKSSFGEFVEQTGVEIYG
jgi:hypothetical protein